MVLEHNEKVLLAFNARKKVKLMLPYFCLIGFPLSIACFPRVNRKKKKSLSIGVFFVFLAVLLALRDRTVGVDLNNYNYYFSRISATPWNGLGRMGGLEYGFIFYNKLISIITTSFQWFLAITAIVCIIPIAYVYIKHGHHDMLEIILFMNMSTFMMLFSGLRQAIAFSLGILAYHFVTKKKLYPYLLLAGIAFLFHKSALILLILYPVYHMKLKKAHLLFINPALAMIFVKPTSIFTLLMKLFGGAYLEKYSTVISDTGAYTMIILFIIFSIFSFIITDEKKLDEETYGLRNILLLTTVLQFFATINTLVMRFNYFFIILIPLLISRVIVNAKDRYRQVAVLANIVICFFFLLYFFYNGYNGTDILCVFPYVPFWNGGIA